LIGPTCLAAKEPNDFQGEARHPEARHGPENSSHDLSASSKRSYSDPWNAGLGNSAMPEVVENATMEGRVLGTPEMRPIPDMAVRSPGKWMIDYTLKRTVSLVQHLPSAFYMVSFTGHYSEKVFLIQPIRTNSMALFAQDLKLFQ
jgi:hypothetical protein